MWSCRWKPAVAWGEVKGFAHAFAEAVATTEPLKFVDTASKRLRKGRIFIDWLRNGRGAASVASFSLRARAGAPVAMPLRWEELSRLKGPAAFDIGNAPARMRRLKAHPWSWHRRIEAGPAAGVEIHRFETPGAQVNAPRNASTLLPSRPLHAPVARLGPIPQGATSMTTSGASTARRQRKLQAQADAAPAAKKAKASASRCRQTKRREPQNPMPAQRLRKPGREADLELQPRWRAPDYRGSGKLEGMAAIVTGADSGIGRAVAVLFAREGTDVAVLYLDEREDAERTKRAVEGRGPALHRHRRRRARQPLLRTRGRKSAQGIRPDRRAGQQRRVPAARRAHRGPRRRTVAGNPADQHRRLLPHGAGGDPAHAARREHRQHRFGNRPVRQQRTPARLRRDQGRDPRLHQVAGQPAAGTRHPRQFCVAPGPVWTPLNPSDRPAKEVAKKFGEDSDARRPAQPENSLRPLLRPSPRPTSMARSPAT